MDKPPRGAATHRPDRAHNYSADVASPELRVIMVCLGNICRSPMAEAIVRHHLNAAGLGDRIAVDSAGTSGWHAGGPADARALTMLRRHGYDLSHQSRQFLPEWLDERDVVLTMDHSNYQTVLAMAQPYQRERVRMLRSFDPALAHLDPDGVDAADLEVPDPFYGTLDDYQVVLDMVQAATPGLIDHLRARLAT